jgi:GTP-binding protein Era
MLKPNRCGESWPRLFALPVWAKRVYAPFLMTDELDMRCGTVSVVGRTNVGKSTLVNRLVGEKVSIVTPVVQTTRNRIRAILTEPRGQLVFIDTPGVHKSENELGKLMNKMARGAAEGTDAILLLFDASAKPRMEDEGWMRRLLFLPNQKMFVLNKCDTGPSHIAKYKELWQSIQDEKGQTEDVTWLNASATEGQGMPELLEWLFANVPLSPLLFSEELLTDYPRKLAIADVIREKLYAYLRDELPHAIAVWVENIDEKPAAWNVEAVVYVNRSSQKGIVLGKGGRLLKDARKRAETDLSDMFDLKVNLDLWVKVEKNWGKNFFFLKKLGYVDN